MQVNNNYNSISFSSRNCPIKPFTIKTSKGTLYCNEINYNERYKKTFYKQIGEFFLDIFANTSSHPFWVKCRKPTLDQKVYDDYIKSSIKEYKKFFKEKDTTVLIAKDENNNIAGAIYTRKLNLGKRLKDDNTLYIDGLAVLPEYRGQNLGKKLLKKVLSESKERFSQAFLVAYKESTAFYEKLKFQKMNPKNNAQKYAIKQLSDIRIDYPEYVDLMQKNLGKKLTDNWYERVGKQ